MSARSHYVSRRTAAGFAAAAALALKAAPAHAAVATSSTGWHPTTGAFRLFRADNGIRLRYHYYADGVDWNRPSGAVFFFDGDGTSRTEQPRGDFALRMARIAAAHNKAFVFLKAPSNTRSWRSGDTAAILSAVRQFATTNIIPTVDAPVLFVGYSGGAEFVAGHLLREDLTWLPRRSGAVLIGGGGTYQRRITPATAATADMAFTWVVGSKDGSYATTAGAWSAKDVAATARAAYQSAGYTRCTLQTVDGGHIAYDIPALLREHLWTVSS